MQTDSGRQSGNVIAFIIVGVALAALLGIGIFVSKQQGRVASRTDTVAVDTNGVSDAGTDKQQPATSNNDKPAEADNSQETAQGSTPPAAAPATGPSNSSNASQSQVPSTGPSSIASTGPIDSMIPAIAFGFVTVGVVSYVRSQRSFRNSALK